MKFCMDKGLTKNMIQTIQTHFYKETVYADVYQYVPQGAKFPYISIEIIKIETVSDLPVPFAQIKIEFEIQIWSAYKGLEEINYLFFHLKQVLDKKEIILEESEDYFYTSTLFLKNLIITGQQDSKMQQCRVGKISGQAFLQG